MEYINAKRYTNYWFNALAILAGAFTAIKDTIMEKNPRKLLSKDLLFILLCCLIGLIIGMCVNLVFVTYLTIPFVFIFGAAIDQQFLHKMRMFDTKTRIQRADTGTYDNADFLSGEDEKKYTEEIQDIYEDTQFIYGYNKKGKLLGQKKLPEGNLNMIVCAPSGFYKGVSFVILNILQMIMSGISGVIASTKDDNFAITRKIAEKFGYKTFLLSLREGEIAHSDRINFIAGINGNLDMAKAVSLNIIQNTSLGERPDYWYRGEANLNSALLAHFSSNPMVPEEDRNLPGILRFLSQGPEEIEDTLSYQMSENDPAWSNYSVWKGGDKVPKMQVVQGLAYRYSSFLGGEDMANLLSANDIDFRELVTGKCLIYLVSSDSSDAYKAISSTFFTMLFSKLESMAMENAITTGETTLPKRVKIMIDEAAAMGEIPRYADTLSTCRGYGFDVITIFQDIPQLQKLYEKSWSSVLNNSSVKMLLKTDDEITAQYFSTLCRTYTGVTKRKAPNGSESESEVKVELMSVSRILGMDPLESLVIISSAPGPMMIKKQFYYADIPGSEYVYYNDYDGKEYKAHPLLEYMNKVPAIAYVPHYKRKKKPRKSL